MSVIPGLPQFNVTQVTSDAAITTEAGHRVMAVLIVSASGGAATLELNDSDDDSGTDLLTLNAETSGSEFVDMSRLGGILFDNGIWADLAGTGAHAVIWWE